jgi:hypothetical protein
VETAPDYFIGLDLGQTADFTALCVLERPPLARGADPAEPEVYSLRHLQRFPLGTPYTEIVPAVAKLAGTQPLGGNAALVVDQTGVGRALVDMLMRTPGIGRVVPVTITGGNAATQTEDGSHHVPKKDLVTSLQLLLQGRRLKIAKGMPEARILVKELENFRVKITLSANETFGAWREGQHDDLVLAVALACWLAQREPRWDDRAFGYARGPGDSIVARLPFMSAQSFDEDRGWSKEKDINGNRIDDCGPGGLGFDAPWHH